MLKHNVLGADVKYIMPPTSGHPVCDSARHKSITKTFADFQCKTTFLARDAHLELIFGNCKACGSTLTVPIEWEAAHYEVLRAGAPPIDIREHL